MQTQVDPTAGHTIYLTRIARVEVTAAFARRGKGPLPPGMTVTGLLTQFRYDLAPPLEISPGSFTEAEQLAELHALRGYEAVQLLASVELHRAELAVGLSTLTLSSSDQELNNAALAERLPFENPNSHP